MSRPPATMQGMQVVLYALAAILFACGALCEVTDFASRGDTMAFVTFGLTAFSAAHLPL